MTMASDSERAMQGGPSATKSGLLADKSLARGCGDEFCMDWQGTDPQEENKMKN